ncbi:MAG: RdgB/HAM1 family non-canonical purine NTP pyrophosphatase [Pirellulaceae bacterium]|nr:non-canonical purine NTP pyrophosphatase, RdgB/HAM1 family [Rhodopirellula sp.]MCH2599941.1 RdgB/HAM1 family non-canonical purine NTP pyrophosphatase [Pirellulales bacterium]HCA51322.1 non-canonical purine NTP pyrophosphatase, RdgB/HAM1 family [Planctomycetaceae bacterium]|tara:strand:- start:307 stop:924 length:618 start_codon:yes stop_codon:yes gene_type:complete
MSEHVLVLGTHNQKKRQELEQLLAPLGLSLLTLSDVEDAIEVEETGTTFSENAALKASQQAQNLGMWVMGEDSGISVVALNNEPGVYSARYSDPGATDQRNNEKVLAELGNTPLEKRAAFYTCHMAISDPTGQIRATAEDYCYGRIRFEPSGENGFGYDPLFEIPEYHRTFGELGPSIKKVLSHRSRAIRKITAQICELMATGGL